MNQAAAKATSRALRRAMGSQAIDVINETQQNTLTLSAGLQAAHNRINSLHHDFVALQEAHANAFLRFEAVSTPLRNSTWWTRLRWVALGR